MLKLKVNKILKITCLFLLFVIDVNYFMFEVILLCATLKCSIEYFLNLWKLCTDHISDVCV